MTLTGAALLAPPAIWGERGGGTWAPTVRAVQAGPAATRHMVAAASPYAVDAGREMLRAGGAAADAAVAAALVLGLVEPESSGLGGGGFVLHWQRSKSELRTWDGRETAPAAAAPDQFLRSGRPLPFEDAVRSGLSVGVPGLVRLIEAVHSAHGKLPWPQLFQPAIRLAEDGFVVSPRLNLLLRYMGPASFAPQARAYFFDAAGNARASGEVLKNPQYAATLRAIADGGPGAFYNGRVADEIVAAVAAAPMAAGRMTPSDLSSYSVAERAPVCVPYRARRVCGMGPPSSGGLAVGQTLMLLEPFDVGVGDGDALGASSLHLIAEAEKLAYADRNRYVGDPAYVTVPAGLLDPAYIAARRALVDPARAMPPPEAGVPPGVAQDAFGRDATRESAGTSHLSVVDDEGNAVAMTVTIEAPFGARLWAAGFLLNNELTDFSLRPADEAGRPAANRVEPGKRPRSSMAPTIVFDNSGELEAVLGSPGGSRIPLYVVKTLVALVDWRLDAHAAAALANFGSRGGPFEIELGWSALRVGLELKAFGHEVVPAVLTSGTHVITVRPDRLEGGADPRREGTARGG